MNNRIISLSNLGNDKIIQAIEISSPLINAKEMSFGVWYGKIIGKESGTEYGMEHITIADAHSGMVQGIIGERGNEESEALSVLLSVLFNHKEKIASALSPKTCHSCQFFEDAFCMHQDVPDGDTVAYIKFSGCGLHKPKEPTP